MSSGTSIRVAIIGYGVSARTYHIPFVKGNRDMELAAVMQPESHPGRSVEKDLSHDLICHSAEEIVNRSDLNLVIITTPPDTHYPLARDILQSGKHVVVESPITARSSEAEQLAKLAKDKGLLLTVFYNRRYDADYVTLSQLIKSGTLGRVVDFESHFDTYQPDFPPRHPWKNRPIPASGALYEIGAHLIDQVLHLLGMPESVTAILGSQRTQNPNGYEEFFTLLLHYPGSVLATVKSTAISPEAKQLRFWVRGDIGSYKKYYHDVQEEQLKSGSRPGDVGFARDPKSHYGLLSKFEEGRLTEDTHPTVDPSPTYPEYYSRLASALKGDGSPPVTTEDSCRVVKLIELAIVSSRRGRTVDVKEIEGSQQQEKQNQWQVDGRSQMEEEE